MIILGLGSNIGDRAAYLRAAAFELATLLEDMRLSRVLESKALLPANAPPMWNVPFLNMAVSGRASHAPEILIGHVKAIEKQLGRKMSEHWSPREIDIDILAADRVVDMPALKIPHPELLNRDFALLPLIDVAPDWRYPLPGRYHQWTAARIAEEKNYRLGPTLRDTGITLHV